MEGKIFGIPLVLIVMVVLIAVVVDLPMVLFNATTTKQLKAVETNLQTTNGMVNQLVVTPTATPSATATVTPTPTSVKVLRLPVVTKSLVK